MKKLLNFAYILIISIISGLFALVLVYCLPTKRMEMNVRSSINVFYTESVYPQQSKGYKSSQLDNETDAIMLLGAIYNDNDQLPPLKKALRVSRIDFTDTDSCCVDLIRYAWENKTPDDVADYTRYWHGYMVWLKPLLLLMDYADIRMLNMMLQLLLLLLLAKTLVEKHLTKYLLPFAMALIVLNPAATAMSLQFSSIYYIMLISMIIILKKHEYFYSRRLYPYIFFTLGIVTVYFDFLTYPMAALCMPLILVVILEYENNDHLNWLQSIQQIILLGIFFGLGYVTMWFSKWLISSAILHENIITNAISEFTLHTGETIIEGERITKIGAIIRNLKVLCKCPYLLILGSYFIYCLFQISWFEIKKQLLMILPVFCICLVPLAWIFVTSSHASWCYWYTYRSFMASVFGVFSALKMLPQRNAGCPYLKQFSYYFHLF